MTRAPVAEVGPGPAIDAARLARNAVWLTGGEVASRLIGLAVAVYLARTLGVVTYGALGVAFALVSYLAIAVDAGLDPYGTREVARDPARLPAVFAQIVLVRLLAALAMAALLVGLVTWLPEEAVGRRELALIYGGRLFAVALTTTWALRGREEMGAIAAGLIVQQVIVAAGVFLLVRRPDVNVALVPLVQVAGELALAGWCLGWLRRRYPAFRGEVRAGARLAMLRESLPVGLAKAVRLVYFQGDLLLIAWLSTDVEAGYFLAANRVILSLALLATLFQQNAFPTVSRLAADDPSRSLGFQEQVSRFGLLLVAPVVVGGAVLSAPAIEALFGSGYRASAPVLGILVLTLPLLILTAGLNNQLLAIGHTKPYLYSIIIGAAVHVALGLAWIGRHGGPGAAAASLAGELSTFCLAAYYMKRRRGALPFGPRLLSVAAAAGVMALVVWWLRDGPVVQAAAVGTLVYASGVLATGGLRRSELRFLLRGWFGSRSTHTG